MQSSTQVPTVRRCPRTWQTRWEFGSTVATIVKPREPAVPSLSGWRAATFDCTINPNIDVVLLGRRDFFATYHVCFDERARSFFVRKHSRR
jgi:hypothetical protein